MKLKTSLKKMKKSLFTFENMLGLLLAILILFDFKIEKSIVNLLNTPLGIIFSLVLALFMFVCLHPIVGFLFLIYLYESIKGIPSLLQLSNESNKKQKEMKKMNVPPNVQVEEGVVESMAPLIKKMENPLAVFKPVTDTSFKGLTTL